MRDFGVLQAGDGWASLTGQFRMTTPDGGERWATVVVDRKNPLAPDGRAAIVIDLDKGYGLAGAAPPDAVKLSVTPLRLQPPRALPLPPR